MIVVAKKYICVATVHHHDVPNMLNIQESQVPCQSKTTYKGIIIITGNIRC